MITLFNMPIFGLIDIDSSLEYYENQIEIDGDNISIDLNFDLDLDKVTERDLDLTKKIIEEIIQKSRKAKYHSKMKKINWTK